MDLYFVRHGQSNIPVDSVQSDYPLSELGIEQWRRLGDLSRGHGGRMGDEAPRPRPR